MECLENKKSAWRKKPTFKRTRLRFRLRLRRDRTSSTSTCTGTKKTILATVTKVTEFRKKNPLSVYSVSSVAKLIYWQAKKSLATETVLKQAELIAEELTHGK